MTVESGIDVSFQMVKMDFHKNVQQMIRWQIKTYSTEREPQTLIVLLRKIVF